MPGVQRSELPAIVGIGATKHNREKSSNVIADVATALKMAVDDAGLKLSDIDGLMVHNISPATSGGHFDRLPQLLGMDIRHCYQTWAHGRLIAQSVHLASLLVSTGGNGKYMAVVAGSGSVGGAAEGSLNIEGWREGGGPHLEHPHYGAVSPFVSSAMAMRRYFEMYGYDKVKGFGTIAVTERKHAMLNPNAFMQTPISLDDYLASRSVVEPLRLLDCGLPTNAATCIIVTSAARARDLRSHPVHILGATGVHASREEISMTRPGLGVFQQEATNTNKDNYRQIYADAGVDQKDIDCLYAYETFLPSAMFSIERMGFCEFGEGADWVQGGRIELGGEIPLNTHGGFLSEGMGGQGHLVEMVHQLRREAGPRQVKDAEVAQYITHQGTSLIMARG